MTELRRTPQQDRARRTNKAILDALAGLLTERPLDGITMADISAGAGVSKAAIYRYYPDRPAVVRALADRYLPHISATLHEAWADRDEEDLIDAYRDLLTTQPVIRAIWITGYSYAELGRYIADAEAQLADELIDAVVGDTETAKWWDTYFRNALRHARGNAEALVLAEASTPEAVAS